MRFAFIDEERVNFPIGAMCRVLGVTRQGYYAWKNRGISAHDRRDEELSELILELYSAHWHVHGAPRIHALLKRRGVATSEKRVARLMAECGIHGASKRQKPRQKKERAEADSAQDLVRRDFSADGPDKVWFADITYIRTHQGWLYLAVVFDIFSRLVVGWAMDGRMDAKLVDDALAMGIERRRPAAGLVHHSDSKNVASRLCGVGSNAVSCKSGPHRSILTRTPIDGRTASAA